MNELMKKEDMMKELNYLNNDTKLEFANVAKTAEKYGICLNDRDQRNGKSDLL